jgi:hypothetical protein
MMEEVDVQTGSIELDHSNRNCARLPGSAGDD